MIWYFCRYDPSYPGVNQKIKSQILKIKKCGIMVQTIFFGIDPACVTNTPDSSYHTIKIKKNSGFFNQFRIQFGIVKTLNAYRSRISPGDILYIRYFGPNPFFLLFLLKKRDFFVITEHQSIEPSEIRKSSGSRLYLLSDQVFGGSIRKNVDGIVGVTDEITRYQIERSGDYKKPCFTLGNGIDTDKITLKKYCRFDHRNLSILCVANVSAWHGLDRLIGGLSAYSGETNVHLHIVGEGPELDNLKKLVKQNQLENKVTFYGRITGTPLDDIYDQCHIAVGSLGLHRIGIHQATPLKVREYTAKGIPSVIGYDDPDFPKETSFVMKVPADDSIIDIQDVIRYASRLYSNQDLSQHIRSFAVRTLDWDGKIKKMVEFLSNLPAGSCEKF